jgi:hypothetical protein
MLNKNFFLSLGLFLLLFLTYCIYAQDKFTQKGKRLFIPDQASYVNNSISNVISLKDDGKRVHYKPNMDWKPIIDSYWGPGESSNIQLYILNYFLNDIDENWCGFPNFTLNWDSLVSANRAKITDSSLSRGAFAALMSHLWLSLRDINTYSYDMMIEKTYLTYNYYYKYKPGAPLLILGGWVNYSYFGAAVTPLKDSSLVVYWAGNNNPLGLQGGDIILGYNGIPWVKLFNELYGQDLPLSAFWSFNAATEEANTYSILRSAIMNWGLFDTIDIIKYSTGSTVHLPTAPLEDLKPENDVQWNDQLPVQGVPYRKINQIIEYGVLDNTKIGYINLLEWTSGRGELFTKALDSLINIAHVSSLIFDFRCTMGGRIMEANSGFSKIINYPIQECYLKKRLDSTNHLVFKPYDTFEFTPGTNLFPGPIAVLIGPGCMRAGEVNAIRLKSFPKIRYFGKRTSGSVSSMSGDIVQLTESWFTSVSDLSLCSKENEYLIHKGLAPDEEVWFDKESAIIGVDPVVKKAVEWISTAVNIPESMIPDKFFLNQNYPNPFNPNTSIAYSIAKPGKVTLKVFNSLGQEIKTLINEKQNSGNYRIGFNAQNLASGIYFYRIVAIEDENPNNTFTESRKMLLIK